MIFVSAKNIQLWWRMKNDTMTLLKMNVSNIFLIFGAFRNGYNGVMTHL